MAASSPSPVAAPVPQPDDEEEFDPAAGAPRPPKASNGHPVQGNQDGTAPGGQGPTSGRDPAHTNGYSGNGVPRGHGAEGERGQGALSSAERPKLGARVDPPLKTALKVCAALEGRPEERLVEEALVAYLYQNHPGVAAGLIDSIAQRINTERRSTRR